jgi:hypothetical protein
MKLKECHAGHVITAVIVVLILFILTQVFPYEFTLQYLDKDMNVITETFTSTKEFNERVEELKEDSVFYWIN